MRVFVSYGSLEDQVTALRLQALGAVNGLTVYVPPAHTRQNGNGAQDPEGLDKLQHADVIWAVVGNGLSPACWAELRGGSELGKSLVVMASPSFAADLERVFGSNVVVTDPDHADRAEAAIMQRLKALDNQQNAKALLALGTLALGLILFASADRT